MTGLIIKLSPKERILINGVVIENGDRRSRLSILTPAANFLRLKDAIHPKDAITPITRICYQIQLILSGDISDARCIQKVIDQVDDLKKILVDQRSQKSLFQASEYVRSRRYYQALKSMKALLPIEQRLLERGVK